MYWFLQSTAESLFKDLKQDCDKSLPNELRIELSKVCNNLQANNKAQKEIKQSIQYLLQREQSNQPNQKFNDDVQFIFKTFDVGSKGYLTPQEFVTFMSANVSLIIVIFHNVKIVISILSCF